MPTLSSSRIHITGIVQGVGFRPFVYSVAIRMGLAGWVRNTSAGVDIEIDGEPAALDEFVAALRNELPPLARIDSIDEERRDPQGFLTFEIIHSEPIEGAFIPISPDVSICPDCLKELFDPVDRRYRYPFINCTNCGPRFTIITDIPYDRPNTTMASFPLCPECSAEYNDPLDRRFHAQPVACPTCGPKVWLEMSGQRSAISGQQSAVSSQPTGDEAILETQRLLASGRIVAVKGLGGFHLACDATNPAAVSELRRRKLRVDKPFAVMMLDVATIAKHCFISEAERELLESRQRPIVILRRRRGSAINPEVAPGQDTIGVMLPYTPLHYLLLTTNDRQAKKQNTPAPYPPSPVLIMIMTSGNLSEEPIAPDNEEARQRLSRLADGFLMHNRPIRTRCDDSVVRVISDQSPVTSHQSLITDHCLLMTRRSRGYAPDSVHLPIESVPLLAAGSELKNTFCLTRGRYAFLSHHIGDMENYETLRAFEDGVGHFERLFHIKPEAIAYDLHPNYLATRYAVERAEREKLPAIGVQHHHAHIAACMADNGLDGSRPVIGVSFDGTGYGSDGAIWGGEFLIADYSGFQRTVHLAYTPLPGGDASTREPWRIALAWLYQRGIEWGSGLPPVEYAKRLTKRPTYHLDLLHNQLRARINTPLTSSMGRLFDAAAALAGIRQTVNYEAQAAIEFEALCDQSENGAYNFQFDEVEPSAVSGQQSAVSSQRSAIVSPTPMFSELLADLRAKTPLPIISARFHNGVAEMVRRVALAIRNDTGLAEVALSGGVWQNTTLLTKTVQLLRSNDFTVYTHRQIPPNDGGLALGQAIVASYRLKVEG